MKVLSNIERIKLSNKIELMVFEQEFDDFFDNLE